MVRNRLPARVVQILLPTKREIKLKILDFDDSMWITEIIVQYLKIEIENKNISEIKVKYFEYDVAICIVNVLLFFPLFLK